MKHAAIIVLVIAAVAAAQAQTITTVPKPIARGTVIIVDPLAADANAINTPQDKCTAPSGQGLEAWAKIYYSGDWPILEYELAAALKNKMTLKPVQVTVPPNPEDSYEPKDRAYSVVFVSKFSKPDGEIIRILLPPHTFHTGSDGQPELHQKPTAPFSTTLPGKGEHYELYIHEREAAVLRTRWVATATDDPMLSALAGFVKQFDPKILAPFAPPKLAGLRPEAVPPCKTYDVELRKVNLPLHRAKIDVQDDLEKISQKTSYTNTPPAHFGLGAIAGVMTNAHESTPRVKIGNDGKLTADPLTGGITLAAVTYHPIAYDPSTPSMTPQERFRLFAGPVLTPEFGLAAGGSLGIVRGLSVNVGYAVVRINTLRGSDTLDAKPADQHHPTRNGHAGALFFGFGYAVK